MKLPPIRWSFCSSKKQNGDPGSRRLSPKLLIKRYIPRAIASSLVTTIPPSPIGHLFLYLEMKMHRRCAVVPAYFPLTVAKKLWAGIFNDRMPFEFTQFHNRIHFQDFPKRCVTIIALVFGERTFSVFSAVTIQNFRVSDPAKGNLWKK